MRVKRVRTLVPGEGPPAVYCEKLRSSPTATSDRYVRASLAFRAIRGPRLVEIAGDMQGVFALGGVGVLGGDVGAAHWHARAVAVAVVADPVAGRLDLTRVGGRLVVVAVVACIRGSGRSLHAASSSSWDIVDFLGLVVRRGRSRSARYECAHAGDRITGVIASVPAVRNINTIEGRNQRSIRRPRSVPRTDATDGLIRARRRSLGLIYRRRLARGGPRVDAGGA